MPKPLMVSLGTVTKIDEFDRPLHASRFACGRNRWGEFVLWLGFRSYTLGSYRKVGGLRFVRIGRLGFSFYITRKGI